MTFSRFLFSFLVASTFFTSQLSAAILPKDEVATLREIAQKLGKTNWDFSVDPCSKLSGWVNSAQPNFSRDAVTCDCTFSKNTTCHVVSIALRSQNLPGILPPELAKLPYIQEIDLTRNYLSGTIPREWGSTKLEIISLLGNRLTGSIPKELGNISTLRSLVVQFNQLSGFLPSELGNLSRIERMFFSSNNFTGEVPPSFAKLTTLKDFRIDDNYFIGNIPNFIRNWTNLTKLVIQASGLSGPIPSGIAQLENMTELIISDLEGTVETYPFPQLSNMKHLKTLILRSCNIIGELPTFIGNLTNIKLLDLSFNNFTGKVPNSYFELRSAENIYLTGNSLSGAIPNFPNAEVDLSYNNFSVTSCPQNSVNVFGTSLRSNNSMVPCLRNRDECEKKSYSFHINCGGKEFNDGNITYEDDTTSVHSAQFYLGSTNWAFSSTGNFYEDNRTTKGYIAEDTSELSTNLSQLYMNARLSPLSLAYYGFCLGNGKYNVDLHFSEIIFTDDKTYSSLGRRVFDVYIQGELVLKDFNIAARARGARKAIVIQLLAVVDSNTLEIRFRWAGRGTTDIPRKGVYGPLISAISVKSNFTPPLEVTIKKNSGSNVSVGLIVGIIVAVFIVVFLVVGFVWWKCCLRQHNMTSDLKVLDLRTGAFKLRQIKAATNNFDLANKIGEGGFGSVYKGLLVDGTVIAVKQLSSESQQGNREFVNEIGMISALHHPHLVQLYGCCIERNQLLLVYEYMENNSLARALFGPEECQLKLDWPTRQKICVGIARGLAYLHEESTLKIVHRDIKATNVLLDEELTAKISDFGLAKLYEEDNTHISTRVAGTYGYMAPEYAMRGHLTDKADVYSFGIVCLEILSGRSNASLQTKEDNFSLLDWALILKEKGKLMELVDPRLESNYDKQEVMVMIMIALLCTSESAAVRPTMSSVVSILEGKVHVQEIGPDPSVTENERNLRVDRDQVQYSEEQSILDSQMDGVVAPWTALATSTPDLYSVKLDSDYWEKRI